MNLQNAAWRGAGVLLVLGATFTGFAEARVISGGDGSVTHMAAAVSGFVIACFGVLLAVHGPRWRTVCHSNSRRRRRGAAVLPFEPRRQRADIDPMLHNDPGFGGGRLALTVLLILQAQERARQGHARQISAEPVARR